MKYFIPKYLAKKDYSKIKTIVSLALIIQIFTALIISCLFYFGSNFLATHYFKNPLSAEALKVFAFFFVGFNILQTLSNFFMAVQDTFYSRLSEFIRMF